MRKIFDSPENTNPTLESLVRLISIETTPALTREVVTEKLDGMLKPELLRRIERFMRIIIETVEEYTDYTEELIEILDNRHEGIETHKSTPLLSLIEGINIGCEFDFIEKADTVKEKARRLSLIALLNVHKSLDEIYIMVMNDYPIDLAVETFLLVRAIFQATHTSLIEETLKVKQAQSKAGKSNQAKQACINMMLELIAEKGKLPTTEFFTILKTKYQNGYKSGEYCFYHALDRYDEDTIKYCKISEPLSPSMLSHDTAERYLTAARREYKNKFGS